MGSTPKLALPYPDGGDPPDVPGDMYNLALALENAIAGGVWGPTLGGGNGATLGSSPGYDGTYSLFGKHVVAKGRLVFGSSASFGTGTATISSLPGTIDTAHSSGYGMFLPPSGDPVPVFFNAIDGANLAIRPVKSSTPGSVAGLGIAFNIGTPAQSSQLIFTLDLTLA